MSANISSMLFISFAALFAIAYLKLAFEPIIAKKEFKIWVISWFVITTLAFFTFNFLLFVLLSATFIFYISKKVEDKLALFIILLFAIPSYEEKLSVFFTVNFTRELALLLLLPIFSSLLKQKKQAKLYKFGSLTTDKYLLSYLILIFLLYFRGLYIPVDPTSPTEGIRYGFYLFCEIFLPYYIASRYIKDFKQFKTVIIAFISICIIVGCIAMLEVAKSWLLYGNLHDFLGVPFAIKTYLSRGGLIRASSSMDHSLVLGTVMLIALGFYLCISNLIKSNLLKIAGFLIILGGLIAPLARGAWLGAFVMLAIYLSFGYKKYRNIALMLIAGFVSLPLLAIIPGGQKILSFLPFIGNVDASNVDYRSQLINQSLLVIKNHPFFGVFDPTAEPEMQVMVQGEGIIDLVNYYLQVTLTFGIVGLTLFILFLLSFALPLYKHLNTFKNQKSMEYLCGKSLLALLIGTFVTISTLSGLNMINTVLFLLAGLTVSYMRVTKNIEVADDSEDKSNKEVMSEKGHYPTSRVVQKPNLAVDHKIKFKGYLK